MAPTMALCSKKSKDEYHVRLTVTYGESFKMPVSTHLKRYKRSFEESFGADFIIEVDGKEIQASRTVLMAQSDYFQTLIEANMREKKDRRMVIVDFDFDVMNALVGYLLLGEPSTERSGICRPVVRCRRQVWPYRA